jgi:hypothetical protein
VHKAWMFVQRVRSVHRAVCVHVHAGSPCALHAEAASPSPCVQFRTSPAPRAATPAPRAPRGSTTRRRARMQPTPWERLGVGLARLPACRRAATCHPRGPSPLTRKRPARVRQAIRRSARVRPLSLHCASAQRVSGSLRHSAVPHGTLRVSYRRLQLDLEAWRGGTRLCSCAAHRQPEQGPHAKPNTRSKQRAVHHANHEPDAIANYCADAIASG